jgi:tRNA pseudouridine38-40 synthase
MPHWKLILTYDGTPYNGWQVQPNLPTVQGTLAEAIHRITGETVLPQGSGRTDAGVHALAQVATLSLTVPIPAANLHRALNRALPASIRVLAVEAVPADFHARHSALRKTYEYRILAGDRICSPMLAPYVWPCRYALDLTILQQAATHILGTHDFTSFAANDPDQVSRNLAATESIKDESADIVRSPQPNPRSDIQPNSRSDIQPNRRGNIQPSQRSVIESKQRTGIQPSERNVIQPNQRNVISTEAAHGLIVSRAVEKSAFLPPSSTSPIDNIRTIHHSTWHQQEDLLIYRITGTGFLHHMVRNLVGTFVEAAAHRICTDEIPTILAARNRSAAGPTAPASGLFLVEVIY